MSTPDVLKLNKQILKRGPSDKTMKPKDTELRVADLENPDEVIATIKARLRVADEYKEPFAELDRQTFMYWMQKLDTKKEKSWESKRQVPLILQQLETAMPIIYSAVFNGPHIWSFRGMTPEGRNAADALDKLVHWQANGPSQMRKEFQDWSFYSLLFGTGILDTGWSNLQETKWVPKVVQDVDAETGEPLFNDAEGTDPKLEKVLSEEEVTVTDWPIVRSINPQNIWLAPHGRSGDGMPWAVERVETTVGEILDAAGGGHIDKASTDEWMERRQGENAEEDADTLFAEAETGKWDDWLAQANLDERRYNDPEDAFDRDQVVFLLEYRSKTERITIAPGDIIIGYSENPHIHQKTGYVVHQFIPIPECPYGRGLGTILLGHQELVNENINLYMDTARISLMAPIIVNRGSINPLDSNMIWTPNKRIYARDINNAAKRMDVPAPDAIAFNLDNHLKKDAQLTTGFSEQSAGVASASVGTATEAQAIQTNLATRTIMHVIRMRDSMTLVGNILAQLNQQYMTEEQIVSVVGEDGLDYHTIKPWEIVGQVMVQSVASATRANPAMRSQQLISVMQVFLPILQQGGMTPVIGRLMRTLLKSIEVEDVDLILPKEALTVRSAKVENIALERGVPVQPTEFENFENHMATHSQRRQELQAEGASEAILGYFDDHIAATGAMAEQAGGQAEAQDQPQTDQLGGDRPGGQQATGLGAAAGNQGVAGAASPGPGGAPGRAL